MQKEKEVLALLSRLDLLNVHFTESPPGMFSSKICFLLALVWQLILCTFAWYLLFVQLIMGCLTVSWYKSHYTSGDATQSVHLVASEGLEAYLPLADMVDISAEVQRLSKRLSKMQSEYDGLVARLNSPKVWSFFFHFQETPRYDLDSLFLPMQVLCTNTCILLEPDSWV